MKYKLVSLGLILIIVFAAFSPCLKNGFVNWDDNTYLTTNPFIKSLSLNNIGKIFSSFYMGNYHPVTMLVYSLEFNFFKLNPFGYHLINLLLHLINCLLVFYLILKLSDKLSVASITTIFWGIHPLNVESVAWVSELKGLLCALFYLSALLCYISYLKKGRIDKNYYLTLIFFVFSWLSKPMAISLPIMLFLMDYFFKRKRSKMTFLDKIPFFALALAGGVISVLGQFSVQAVRQENVFAIANKIVIAIYAVFFYLSKILIPLKLSCYYLYVEKISAMLAPYFLIYLVIAVYLGFMLFFFRKRARKLFFAITFYLIAISPALQFVPIGLAFVADRYAYIGSIGIFYILAEGFIWLYLRKIKYSQSMQVFFLISLVLIGSGLFFLTQSRCRIWKDSVSLWSDVIKNYPKNVTAYNNRGTEWLSRKEYQKAYLDFFASIMIDPEYAAGYYNMGILSADLGKFDQAIDNYNRAIKFSPNRANYYSNRGIVYSRLGKLEQALGDYNKAIEIKQDYGEAYNNRAALYFSRKEFKKALEDVKKARSFGCEVNPNFIKDINQALEDKLP